MLLKVFEKLNAWMTRKNRELIDERGVGLSHVKIQIIGQAALLEAKLSFDILGTLDVDTYNQIEYSAKKKFEELLDEQGYKLDPVGHEAWMPKETDFRTIYHEQFVTGLIAEPVFIMIAKAKMAPIKNKQLIVNYLASSDLDKRFFDLAKKYQIDLESFL